MVTFEYKTLDEAKDLIIKFGKDLIKESLMEGLTTEFGLTNEEAEAFYNNGMAERKKKMDDLLAEIDATGYKPENKIIPFRK